MYSSTLVHLVFILVIPRARSSVKDAFRLAEYYSDHMVLQREPDSSVIWGYAQIGAQITVIFKEMKYTSTALAASFTSDGVWQVTLVPQPPSGPFTIKITSDYGRVREFIDLQNVLFGDVWVCSGQSNMAFDVKAAFNGSEALDQSYKYSHIRVLAVKQVQSPIPFYDLQSVYEPWSLPNPDTLGAQNTNFELYFSAVCWFFGRDLFEHLHYPIGLISTNWGGTPIEAWSSPEVMKTCNVTSPGMEATLRNELPQPNDTKAIINDLTGPNGHSVLWNSMIQPLLNMTIKGAIWYQGEDNAVHDPSTYNCLFPAMITDWRRRWHEGTGRVMNPQFPFGFVQLCNSEFPIPGNANFTALRWHQTADYGYTPNPRMPGVFMAVAIDLPDVKSPHGPIHPRDKQDVSARLLLGAQAVAYRESYITFQGPFPSSITMDTSQFIHIQFDGGNATLITIGDGGFDVCCSETVTDCPIQGNSSWFPSTIVASFQNATVMIKNPCMEHGVAVRYIWRDLPCKFKECPLYDAISSLPVPPFFLPVNVTLTQKLPNQKSHRLKSIFRF